MLKRQLFEQLEEKIEPNKVVILYGPRRVGKTTILKMLAEKLKERERIKFLNGENSETKKVLSSQSIEKLREYIGDVSLLIIDEAQRVDDIGLNLKLIVDNISEIKVIASGSASFSLAQRVGEPLTGRKKTLGLYPISAKEIISDFGMSHYLDIFDSHLIYGGYPECFNLEAKEKKIEYLGELIDSYLYRDILEIENVRNPKKIRDLLTLLAFQIGREVSLNELANNLDLHVDTVFRYLDLLEKSFVLINIRGFSRNLRKEVTKTSRYYFYDNGVRNALINNFNPLSLRDDMGELWENYIVLERLKKQSYDQIRSNNYFWRTYDQKEIDWVEEREGKIFGFEIKWGEKIPKIPRLWKETYPNSEYEAINRDNYLKFIT